MKYAWGVARTAIIILAAFAVLTGLVYPLIMVGVGEALFGAPATGGVVYKDDKAVGSALIGQQFVRPEYFQPRPSAVDYDASRSGASNLGPTNARLVDEVRARTEKFPFGDIPADIVTSSGSGLDPHISPAAAKLQAGRVAEARGASRQKIEALIDEMTEGRTLGFLGEPRVNVLMLNLRLDEAFPISG